MATLYKPLLPRLRNHRQRCNHFLKSKLQSGGEANASAAEEISRTMGQLAQTIQQTFTQVQRFTLA